MQLAGKTGAQNGSKRIVKNQLETCSVPGWKAGIFKLNLEPVYIGVEEKSFLEVFLDIQVNHAK
jgi:hypothetical protein